MQPAVRRARPDDVEAIARVHVDAWRAAYRAMLSQAFLDDLDVAERVHMWRGVLDGDDLQRPLVAEVDGNLTGFAAIGPCRPGDGDECTGEVYAINIAAAAWGRGVGHALFAAAIDLLRERGFSVAVLWVARDNHRARRFYERHGWAEDGEHRVDRIGGVDLPVVRYRVGLAADTGTGTAAI